MSQPEPLRGEFAYIDWIRLQVPPDRRVPIGIGDDAAALRFTPGREVLVTTDMILEGVHFDLLRATFDQVGRKALAVNLSDIAAMAGVPVAAVASVGLPTGVTQDQAELLFHGMYELAREFEVALVGGDTNRSTHGLVISITLLGEATALGPVRRSGARPGDWILVTGALGGSIFGKHLRFTPRVREAMLLHDRYHVHSMIDVSDGLAADLGHILEQSGVAAILHATQIPISEAARSASDATAPLDHALYDGEDFELVFTLAELDARRLIDDRPLDIPVTHIGEITPGCDLLLEREPGDCVRIEPRGYDHFKR